MHNRSIAGHANGPNQTPDVRVGDRLICVNDTTVPGLMVETLSNPSVQKLTLRFSRQAGESSPGVWEADVERSEGEGWGMELRDQVSAGGPRGAGALRIEALTPGLAIDRWNR